MELFKQISWQQGLFLQPQHFQLIDAHHDFQRSNFTRLTHAYGWGSEKINIDKAALQEQQVKVVSGTILFKSGALVAIGENAVIAPRSFSKSWENRSKPLIVYLGVRRLDEHVQNVTTVKSLSDVKKVQTRYVALEQPELVKDMYHGGPDAHINQQLFVLQLIWSHELEESAEYELIQIGKVVQRGDKLILDSQFIPPCLSIRSYHQLNNLVKDLRDDLYARAKQLDLYKFPTAGQDNAAVTRQWFNLLALQVFNRYIPVISHLLVVELVTPAECFGVLLQLVGELKTFSQEESVTLGGKERDEYFIEYQHNNLTEIFDKIRRLIFKLCDNITFVPHQFFALDYINDVYTTDLPSSVFTPRTSYYLRIHAEENTQELSTVNFESQLKVGSVVSIDTIIERALSGIPIEMLDSAPAGVPKDSVCVYCRLDPTAEEWRSVVSSQSISVFWAEPIAGVSIDFVSVRS